MVKPDRSGQTGQAKQFILTDAYISDCGPSAHNLQQGKKSKVCFLRGRKCPEVNAPFPNCTTDTPNSKKKTRHKELYQNTNTLKS